MTTRQSHPVRSSPEVDRHTQPDRFRLFYVDDSGSASSGIVVYSWLECDATSWRTGWQSWLDLRHSLQTRYGVPVDYQLHASTFAAGRGDPSTDPDWNRRKHLRRIVMRTALAHIAATPGVSVGTVYRRTSARRRAYADHRADVYQLLVAHLNTRLAQNYEHGLVFGDGDGSDPTYAAAHRALTGERRRVVEDPQFPGARRNIWLQCADFVAWTAYQHLHRAQNRQFAWHWYDAYLGAADVHGGPLAL
jgi:hypothetical protein